MLQHIRNVRVGPFGAQAAGPCGAVNAMGIPRRRRENRRKYDLLSKPVSRCILLRHTRRSPKVTSYTQSMADALSADMFKSLAVAEGES